MKRISILLITVFALCGCKKFVEPALQNNGKFENIYDEPLLAHGLLLNGYTRIPTNGWTFSDVATDNAVSNDLNSGLSKIATGQWTASFNPLDQWTNSKAAIQYLNMFLTEADKVTFDALDPKLNQMFKDRLKGEGYGLRAMFMYYMLQAHGGKAGGELLGFPLLLQPENPSSDFNQPRAKFDDCMKQIYADLDQAEELLPLDYRDISSPSDIPVKYNGVATETYNRVFGRLFSQRFTARIAKAIRAKAALMAASPAFAEGSSTTWENAANFAAAVIDLNGGVNGLAANGLTWYAGGSGNQIDGLGSGANPAEVMWRTSIGQNSDLEASHFPPTLSGSGRLNPTQNLVNAFPAVNGYPIDNTASGYNEATPYANRDPRLALYIVLNGSTAGPGSTVIYTATDRNTNDGLNKVETSTRTGYYMRKLLRQDVNRNSSSISNQKHYNPHIRYTEIYLSYAEAANEAWGPLATGGHSYSAYDVIKKIRQRAGIGLNNGDAYLESIKGDKNAMRTLIRNERRLELCFEGFRFWDLRRWNANLNEPALGVNITQSTYTQINVENRAYASFMNYGPVPYSEILKFKALQQNNGW
ncbi:RagB/SusD family nutrient uptake outer membrane protein [Mucilaginibacter roseus]|uniref:RagB/SusD family nutrient uptake outer membrane protein n=1 Tax=Mucilaginibacter roseus TaxID=1528868 RepID=A0ABS8TY38_9SPHI|nr:RagB/SusD family nutrient uptake outer membrane protein [Mucilaginibacter roseus]MCD8739282.1 RagB/SusD family nutrient uptake outer membrane protein [Mucilaginibacter roseus]